MHWTQLWNWNALGFGYCDPVIWFCTLPMWSFAFSKACFVIFGVGDQDLIFLFHKCSAFYFLIIKYTMTKATWEVEGLFRLPSYCSSLSKAGWEVKQELKQNSRRRLLTGSLTLRSANCLTQPGTCCRSTVPPTVGTPTPTCSHQTRQSLTDLSQANLTDAILQLGFPLPR